jgi:hypothetical protein
MHRSDQLLSCSSATSATASRKEKFPHKRAALSRNSSTASLSRHRRRTASTWKRPSSMSCASCASNEQTHHHLATPRATTHLRARATALRKTRITTTTEGRNTGIVGHGRTEVNAGPSVLCYDPGSISTRVQQESKGDLHFGAVEALCVSCTIRIPPQHSLTPNDLERTPTECPWHARADLRYTAVEPGITAKAPAVLVLPVRSSTSMHGSTRGESMRSAWSYVMVQPLPPSRQIVPWEFKGGGVHIFHPPPSRIRNSLCPAFFHPYR